MNGFLVTFLLQIRHERQSSKQLQNLVGGYDRAWKRRSWELICKKVKSGWVMNSLRLCESENQHGTEYILCDGYS